MVEIVRNDEMQLDMVKSCDKTIIFLMYHIYLIYLQLYNWETIKQNTHIKCKFLQNDLIVNGLKISSTLGWMHGIMCQK